METRKIYPLRNDFVFKCVFGKEGNEPLLACLIEAILGLEGDRRIKELTLLSPLNLQNWADEKFTIVDVKAIDLCNRRFTIEMQVSEQPDFEKRMAYYLALLYAGQLREGDGYEKLYPAFGIAILDYVLFPEHECLQSRYAFREQASGEVLPGIMELHFVELRKYRDRPRALQTRLEKWLNILRFGEQFVAEDPLPEDYALDKEFVMAVSELRRINADEQMRAILEQREKEERDRISRLNAARKAGLEEGLEKGLENGREEKALAIARNMVALKIDPAVIIQATEISPEQLRRLQEE